MRMNEILAMAILVMIAITCMHVIDWIMHDGIEDIKNKICKIARVNK